MKNKLIHFGTIVTVIVTYLPLNWAISWVLIKFYYGFDNEVSYPLYGHLCWNSSIESGVNGYLGFYILKLLMIPFFFLFLSLRAKVFQFLALLIAYYFIADGVILISNLLFDMDTANYYFISGISIVALSKIYFGNRIILLFLNVLIGFFFLRLYNRGTTKNTSPRYNN